MKLDEINTSYLQEGRASQKQRTRQRVLDAAAHLIRKGESPTVSEAADKAKVSRRTAYRYFRTQQQMLAEAALVISRAEVWERDLPPGRDQRLEMMVRNLQDFVYRNEAALRLLEQQFLQRPLSGRQRHEDGLPPRTNRVRFIESALQGVRDQMKPKEFERLVSALVLCVGIEAAVALGLVRGLSPAKATEVCQWAAQKIVDGALAESKASGVQTK